jgi:hypothetical protein
MKLRYVLVGLVTSGASNIFLKGGQRGLTITVGWFAGRMGKNHNNLYTELPHLLSNFTMYIWFTNVTAGRITRPLGTVGWTPLLHRK